MSLHQTTQIAATALGPSGDVKNTGTCPTQSQLTEFSIGLSGVPAATSLCLAALRSVFFLDTDKAQTTAMLPDNPGALNAFGEPLQQLFK